MMTFRSDARKQSPGVREALRALRLERRPPTEADRPPASTFPGRKERRLRGQLDLLGSPMSGGDEAA